MRRQRQHWGVAVEGRWRRAARAGVRLVQRAVHVGGRQHLRDSSAPPASSGKWKAGASASFLSSAAALSAFAAEGGDRFGGGEAVARPASHGRPAATRRRGDEAAQGQDEQPGERTAAASVSPNIAKGCNLWRAGYVSPVCRTRSLTPGSPLCSGRERPRRPTSLLRRDLDDQFDRRALLGQQLLVRFQIDVRAGR